MSASGAGSLVIRRSLRPIANALLAATLLGLGSLVFATRTFVMIDRQRMKLIEVATPPNDGALEVAAADVQPVASIGQPLALIARIRNDDSVHRSFAVEADGEPVCTADVAASSTARVDCSVQPRRSTTSMVIRIHGAGGGWFLEYLELATHHGSGDGVFTFVFLPATSMLGAPPGRVALVVFVLAFALLSLVPGRVWGRPLAWTDRAVKALSGLVLGIALLSPWVTPYKVLMSDGTCVLLMSLGQLPRLTAVWRWMATPITGESPLRTLRPLLVGLLVALAYGRVAQHQVIERHHGNYSGFLQISRELFDRNPLFREHGDVADTLVLNDNGGYDGQFAYFVAYDPLLRAFVDDPAQYRLVVDAVPYRYGRIGFSALVRLVTAGQWRLFPAAMIVVIVIAAGVAATCLALMAQAGGSSPMAGALMLFVPGFWQSLQLGLPEPLAAALLLAGAYALSRRRDAAAILCFACTLLVRETGVVLVGCLAVSMWLSGDRRRAIWVLAATTPMILWRIYVGAIIFPDWGWRGFLDHPQDLGAPFAGFIDLWRVIASGAYYGGSADFVRAGLSYPALLAFGAIVATYLVVRAPSAANVAALVYAAIGVCLNYPMIWVHVGNGQRGTYELFVMLAISTAAIRSYRRSLRYLLVLFWIGAAGYALFGAFDAAAIRDSIGLPV